MPDNADLGAIVLGELGTLRIWANGTELVLRGDRAKAVLATLALRGERGASLDYLVDTVWPDQPPTARRSLANVVRRLRSLLGADAIVTDGSTYRLNAAVRSHRAFLLKAANRASSQDTSPSETLALAEEVDKMWRGNAWADFDFESPLIGDRVVVKDAFLGLLAAAALAAQSLDQHLTAIGYLKRLVAKRPHHERWWCALADSVAKSGDRAEALRWLQSARSALDQVGLTPSVELLHLEQRLLGVATSPSSEPAGDRLRQRLGSPSLPVAEDLPFVGRTEETTRLLVHDDAGPVPRSSLALIEGPAGVGKSRLMIETARRCQQHAVFNGRCEEAAWSTLGPFHQILEDYASAFGNHATTDGQQLASKAADLLSTASLSATGEPIEEHRERVVRTCVSVLLGGAEHTPHLLLIDDLQWASETAFAIVETLANRAEPANLSMIATCRFDRASNPTHDRITRMLGSANHVHLLLGPLERNEVQTLADTTDGVVDADLLFRRSGGNPFYVTELLRSDAGLADDKTLSRVVRSRVELVHPLANRFMTAAALCGLEFDPWLVGEALGFDPGTTNDLIDELAGHHLVMHDERSRVCAFAHGLVAEAMTSTSDSHERRRFHLAIAEAEQHNGTAIELWVEHLLAAGPLVDTHHLTMSVTKATGRLVRQSRPDAALPLLDRLLRLRLEARDRVIALTSFGIAARAAGDGRSFSVLLEASEIAMENGFDAELADVAMAYSTGGPWSHNNDPHGERLLTVAIERCPPDSPDLLIRLQAHLANYSIFSGPLETRAQAAQRAISIARRSGSTEALGESLNGAILAVSCPAMLNELRILETELLQLEMAGLALSEMRNRPAISTFWSGDGERFRADVADRRAGKANATFRELQTLNGLETVVSILDDNTAKARALLARQVLGNDVERGNHAWNSVMIEWLDDDIVASKTIVQAAYDDFRGGPLRYTLLWLAVEAGDERLIRELYDTITPARVERLPELLLGGFGLAGLAMTATKLQDLSLCELVRPVLAAMSGQMIGVPWSSLPSADFFLTALALATGDTHAAIDYAQRARQVHERMTAPAFNRLLDDLLTGPLSQHDSPMRSPARNKSN